MEWAIEDVVTRQFTEYEHDTLGRRVTGYSDFIGVACRSYKALNTEQQMDLIEAIYGEPRYTTEVNLHSMDRLVWSRMVGLIVDA